MAVIQYLPDKTVREFGPGARRWLTRSGSTADEPTKVTLHEHECSETLVRFLPESDKGPDSLSPYGLDLLWGKPGGAVRVVNLVEVNRRLTKLDLGR
jgi:hypothetical protein